MSAQRKLATPFRAKKLKALRAVQAALDGLTVSDVVDVLTQQISEAVKSDQGVVDDPRFVSSVLAYRGRVSKIENDPELEAFILAQSGHQTLEHIRKLCIKEFGKARAPSRSALHRYIHKLKYRNGGEKA